jgi:hypothetical protein
MPININYLLICITKTLHVNKSAQKVYVTSWCELKKIPKKYSIDGMLNEEIIAYEA